MNNIFQSLFIIIMIVAGLLAVSFGAHKGDEFDIYVVLITIGSTFLGVSVGMYFNTLMSNNKENDMLLTVKDDLCELKNTVLQKDLLISDSSSINNILGIWHQYNVTKKNGKYYWIHVIYDIKATSTGEISFEVTFKDNNGDNAIYEYSGFIRDDRVVFVGKPKSGTQPCYVIIFPHLTNNAAKYHCGFCINQSWDLHETLIPCLLSRDILVKKNHRMDDVLDKFWKDGIKDLNISLLPRVS